MSILVDPKRQALARRVLPPLVGLSVALLAWTLCLLAESVLRSGGWPLSPAEAASLVPLAGRATLLLGAALGLARLLATPLLERGRVVLAVLLAPLAAAWPAHLQSIVLTAGEQISKHPDVASIRVALAVLFAFGWTCVWAFHLALAPGTRRLVRRRSFRLERFLGSRTGAVLTWLAGLVGLAVLIETCATRLPNHLPFALSLVPAAWLLSTTLAAVLLPRAAWHATTGQDGRVRAHPAAAALILLGVAASTGAAVALAASPPESHASILPRARLAALVQRLTRLSPPDVARFDVDRAAMDACPPLPQATVLPPLEFPKDARRHVLLVSVDALRRDVLHANTPAGPVAPHLRAAMARGLTPRRAVTPYPATLFGLGSALTGETPSSILFAPAIPDNVFRLTRDAFDRQHLVLPQSSWFLQPVIHRLFVQGAPLHFGRGARAETDGLLALLDEERAQGLSTFGWIHYYEPHAPYEREPGCDLGPGDPGAYLCEVAAVDRAFGEPMAHAEAQGWLQDTLIIVFADHGQALGERGYFGHHVYLNSWMVDVPLTVLAPGALAIPPRELASLADIAPTVLHFMGLPIPPQLAGRSLLLADPPAAAPRYVVSEAFPLRGEDLFSFALEPPAGVAGLRQRLEDVQRVTKGYSPKVAIQSGALRLIVDRVTGARELYDVDADPANEHDLQSERRADALALEHALRDWHAEQSRQFLCRARAAATD